MSQWVEIRHLHLVEGVATKQIARRLQLDIKTVRRALVQPTLPVRVSSSRVRSLDRWREQLAQWLDLDRDAVLQVFGCGFVADAADIVFVGGVGTSKTRLAIALGMACYHHDYRVRFVTAAGLVTPARRSAAAGPAATHRG